MKKLLLMFFVGAISLTAIVGCGGGGGGSSSTSTGTPQLQSNPGGTPDAPSEINLQSKNEINANTFYNYFTYNARLGETIYIHATLNFPLTFQWLSRCGQSPSAYAFITLNGVPMSCDEDLTYTFEEDGIYTFQVGFPDGNSEIFNANVTL